MGRMRLVGSVQRKRQRGDFFEMELTRSCCACAFRADTRTKPMLFSAGGLHDMPVADVDLSRAWSDEILARLDATDFANLTDTEFYEWMKDPEVSVIQAFTLPDVPWARTLSVEEGLAMGLDDASFRPGQAFKNKRFWAEVTQGSEFLMRWVNDGYSVYVKDFGVERKRAEHGNAVKEHAEFVEKEIAKLQEMGVVSDITAIAISKDEARCVMSLVVAINGEGKKRLC